MAATTTIERRGYTLRAASRAYGISRWTLAAAIRRGELPAARLGTHRLTILASDIESFLRRHAVRPTSHAEAVVEEVLRREEQRSA